MDLQGTSSALSSDRNDCETLVREQIEILWRYHQRGTTLDPAFVETHARTIVQVAVCMKDPNARIPRGLP